MADAMLVYVGNYTRGAEGGIHVYTMDESTGALSLQNRASGADCPSFFDLSPDGTHLYCVNELGEFEGKPSGGVSAFAIDPDTGDLHRLNLRPSLGPGPCHIAVAPNGKHVVVSNYGGGNVCALPIEPDGSLGEPSDFVQHRGSSVNPSRQQAPYAHSATFSPDGEVVFVADLGMDKLMAYRLDAQTGQLRPNDPPFAALHPGAGPRHFAFHPSGRFGYVINELDSTMSAFAYDASTGALTTIQSLTTLPKEFHGSSFCADVHVAASGRFLYGSNRGHDSIVAYAIADDGTLTTIDYTPTQGKNPRNFGLAPSGKLMLAGNQNSDTIVAYHVNTETGKLTPTGAVTESPTPVCIRFRRLSG